MKVRACSRFVSLLGRNFVGLYRNPASLIGRVIISVFVSLSMLLIFWQIGDDETKTREVTSSLFFICIAQLALYEFATVLEFQKERKVFMREHASKLYGSGAYYLSKLALELPLLLMLPLLENVMTFWGIGYRSDAFFKFYLVYILTVQVGTSMGYFISCLFDNMISAAQMTPFAVMPSVLFAGFLVNVD